MTWTVDQSGTETPFIPAAATFTNGSANITITGYTAVLGDGVLFTTTGTLPTNFSPSVTYFVVQVSPIQVSATIGGGAITAGSAGSGTHTAYTEHILGTTSAFTTSATYVLSVDTHLMVNIDLLELRCYDMVDGSNYRQMWKGTYQHVQINNAKASPPIAVTTQARFTLRQLAGTARAFAWSVRRI